LSAAGLRARAPGRRPMPVGMPPRTLARRLAPPATALAGLAALALALAPSAASAACSTNFAPALGATNAVCAVTNLVVSPNPLDPGVAATFDGSGSTGDTGPGDIASYAWDFGDGMQDTTATATTTHAYGARGHYVASLTTFDASNAPIATSAPVSVYVSATPVAAFTPPAATVRPGVAYAFDASASNAPDAAQGGSIASYHWDWGDGSTTDTTSATASHAFPADGASTGVTLTVVNDVGLASAPVTHAITVQDQLPVVQLAATPPTVNVGQQVSLSAAGSLDPDGAIVEYRWDLDANGSFETSTGTGTSATAGPFPNAGVITLRVKAIDDSGEASVRGVNVTVADPTGATGVGGGTGGSGAGSGGSGTSSSGSGSGGAGGGSAGAGGSGGAGGSTGDPFVLGLSGTAIQRLAAVLRHGVGLKAQANRLATGTLTLTISARDARKLRLAARRNRKPIAIGTLHVSLRPGRASKPAIKLTSKAVRALRHARLRTLRVTVNGTLAAGAEHATALRVILLRR
jgi:PKD repeat protein